MLWIIVAFFAGMLFWYYASNFIIRQIFRSGGKWMREIVQNLPQDGLLKLYTVVSEEVELRKKGAHDSGSL